MGKLKIVEESAGEEVRATKTTTLPPPPSAAKLATASQASDLPPTAMGKDKNKNEVLVVRSQPKPPIAAEGKRKVGCSDESGFYEEDEEDGVVVLYDKRREEAAAALASVAVSGSAAKTRSSMLPEKGKDSDSPPPASSASAPVKKRVARRRRRRRRPAGANVLESLDVVVGRQWVRRVWKPPPLPPISHRKGTICQACDIHE